MSMLSHITNNSGVYKITSPSGKIYIGEAINIRKRLKRYFRLECVRQNKLYNSFLKYGVINHIFEVIEECDINDLKCRERYWQDYYDVLGKNGLNLILTSCENNIKIWSEDVKSKMIDKLKQRYKNGAINPFKDKKHKKETIELLSKINKGSNNPRAKIVIDLQTGVFYYSATEVAEIWGINKTTLQCKLNGNDTNNTNFKYC